MQKIGSWLGSPAGQIMQEIGDAPSRTPDEQEKKRARQRAERVGGADGGVFGRLRPTKKAKIDRSANEVATSPKNDTPEPTEAQISAGNYKVGHLRLHGLDISIENPRDSKRSGVDRNGKRWISELSDHYGYIRGTESRDGEQVDVFLGPNPQRPDAPVFVIDQVNPDTGRFDEHKVVLGAKDRAEAETIYRRNYARGWQGLGTITELSIAGFKDWLANGDTTQRVKTSKWGRKRAVGRAAGEGA